MTGRTLRAHAPLIKGGKKGTDIITDGVRNSLSAANQEAAKLQQVPPVIRNTVGGKALLDTGIVKIVSILGLAGRNAT